MSNRKMAAQQLLRPLHPLEGPHMQLVVHGKFFGEVLTSDEKEAVMSTQVCKASASARKEVKATIEKRTLNQPKMASSADAWRKIVEEAAAADVGLHRQRVLSAGKKIVKFWPVVNDVVSPILGNLAFYQANAAEGSSSDLSDDDDDNLPFKAIMTSSKKRTALDDDDADGDVDDEDAQSEEMDCDEEEICSELATTSTKSKSLVTPTPKKKARSAGARKEYVIPGISTPPTCIHHYFAFLLFHSNLYSSDSKLVSIAGVVCGNDNFAIFDISSTKKIHFGNDQKLADLLE